MLSSRGVAQMVERYIRDVEVARSNRVTPIIKSLGGIFMDVAREDLERCKKVVGNLFLQIRGFELSDAQLTDITRDIMIISDSHGGSFSNDIILGFAKGYIDSNLYSKYIDTNQSKLVD